MPAEYIFGMLGWAFIIWAVANAFINRKDRP